MQGIFVSIVCFYALINFFFHGLLFVFSIQIRSVCLRDSLKMYVTAAAVCYKFLKRLAMVAIIKYHMISFFFNSRFEVVLEVTRYVFLWLEIFLGRKRYH